MAEVKAIIKIQEGKPIVHPDFKEEANSIFSGAVDGDQFEVTYKKITPKQVRSLKMNNALHKFCQMAADAMNQSGWDMVKVFSTHKPECDVPWQMEDVKERMFKPVLGAIAESDKTSKATNKELCEVEARLGKFFAEKLGIVIEWPSNSPPPWRSENEA